MDLILNSKEILASFRRGYRLARGPRMNAVRKNNYVLYIYVIKQVIAYAIRYRVRCVINEDDLMKSGLAGRRLIPKRSFVL